MHTQNLVLQLAHYGGEVLFCSEPQISAGISALGVEGGVMTRVEGLRGAGGGFGGSAGVGVSTTSASCASW